MVVSLTVDVVDVVAGEAAAHLVVVAEARDVTVLGHAVPPVPVPAVAEHATLNDKVQCAMCCTQYLPGKGTPRNFEVTRDQALCTPQYPQVDVLAQVISRVVCIKIESVSGLG